MVVHRADVLHNELLHATFSGVASLNVANLCIGLINLIEKLTTSNCSKTNICLCLSIAICWLLKGRFSARHGMNEPELYLEINLNNTCKTNKSLESDL